MPRNTINCSKPVYPSAVRTEVIAGEEGEAREQKRRVVVVRKREKKS
jgi:hypothetical protein